jgi:hypothetical protein
MGQENFSSEFQCLQSYTENRMRLKNRPGEKRVLYQGKILEIWLELDFPKK